MLAALNMSQEDNDAAPTPNHSLIASLLPTIRPPAALLQPDGHTKRATAQAVIGKVLGLLLIAGLLGSVYAFGEITGGTGCMKKLSFSAGKLDGDGLVVYKQVDAVIVVVLVRPDRQVEGKEPLGFARVRIRSGFGGRCDELCKGKGGHIRK